MFFLVCSLFDGGARLRWYGELDLDGLFFVIESDDLLDKVGIHKVHEDHIVRSSLAFL